MITDLTSESTRLPLKMIPILLVLCLPSLFGCLLLSLALSITVPSLYMVFVRKQVWKRDMTMISVASSVLSSILYTLHSVSLSKQVSLFEKVWSTFAFFAPVPFLSLICLLFTLPGLYISIYFALMWTTRAPRKSLNIVSDWDVVP